MDKLGISRESTALVVIDLQKGIASADRQLAPHSASEVVGNAAKLAEAFRQKGMPVFLVHVVASDKERLSVIADEQNWGSSAPGKDWSDFMPELGRSDRDIVIAKRQWGAFYGTDLELQLRRRGMDTIVLCGISTNHGVESTARFAYEYGFQQIFAEDAMSSMTAEMHNIAIGTSFRRMGRVRTTQEILDSL